MAFNPMLPTKASQVRRPSNVYETVLNSPEEQQGQGQQRPANRLKFGFGGNTAGGGMGQGFKINARPTAAPTADDVIRRQGGLAPSYGPTGINGLYEPDQHVGAWERLQNSMARANGAPAIASEQNLANKQQFGNEADRLERANQLTGMGGAQNTQEAQNLQGAQNFTDQARARDQAQADPATAANAAAKAVGDTMANFQMPAFKRGGGITPGMATVAEKEPEYEFEDSGKVDRFDKPTLLSNPPPGVVVPNHALQHFLQGYRHPSKDVSQVALPQRDNVTRDPKFPAFDRGGLMPIGMGTNGMGGMAGLDAPVPGAVPDGKGGFNVMMDPVAPIRYMTRGPQPVGGQTVAAFDEGGLTDPSKSPARWTEAKSKLLNVLVNKFKNNPEDLVSRFANYKRPSGIPDDYELDANNIREMLRKAGINRDQSVKDAFGVNVGPEGMTVYQLAHALAQDKGLLNKSLKVNSEGDVETKPVATTHPDSAPSAPKLLDEGDVTGMGDASTTQSLATVATPSPTTPTVAPATAPVTPTTPVAPYQPYPTVNQPLRRFLQSWENPAELAAGRAIGAERFADSLASRGLGYGFNNKGLPEIMPQRDIHDGKDINDDALTPYGPVGGAIPNDINAPPTLVGTQSNAHTIEGLPAADWFQRKANGVGVGSGTNAFSQRETPVTVDDGTPHVAPPGPMPVAPPQKRTQPWEASAFDKGGAIVNPMLKKFLAMRRK